MSADGRELPMAPTGCALDGGGLVEQLDRYRRLGTTAASIKARTGAAGLVRGERRFDLLRETIAIERGCCSFFTLDYDASDRRLSITVEDPDRLEALGALLSALSGPGTASAARWSR